MINGQYFVSYRVFRGSNTCEIYYKATRAYIERYTGQITSRATGVRGFSRSRKSHTLDRDPARLNAINLRTSDGRSRYLQFRCDYPRRKDSVSFSLADSSPVYLMTQSGIHRYDAVIMRSGDEVPQWNSMKLSRV